MPITKWIHPLTRKEVALDHFDNDKSFQGRPAANPWICRQAAKQIEGDVRHAGLDLTATRTMGCPRQVYIETQFPYSIDPTKIDLRSRGTICHSGAEKHFNPDVFMTESTHPVELTIPVTLGGYKCSMKADVIRVDLTEIIDLKFPSDFSLRFRKDFAKGDHCVQLNLARIGLDQQQWALDKGYDPNKVLLTIWDHAMGPNAGSKGLKAMHMSEEAILQHKPGGGEYTIEQILAVHAYMLEQHEAAMDTVEGRRKVAGSLPLVGETMYNCKKCMMYCDVQSICEKLVVEFGKPEAEFDSE